MKLLYIVQYFSFPDQNGGTRAYDLATSFAKQGVEVVVLTTDSRGQATEKWSEVSRDGIRVLSLNCPYNNHMGFFRRIRAFLSFLIQATIKGRSIASDLILASSTPLTVGIPALFLRFLYKRKYIFEVRDVWPSIPIAMGYFKNTLVQKLLYKLEGMIYRYAEAVVPLSSGMALSIEKRSPHKCSVTIPNISEIGRFVPGQEAMLLDLPKSDKILLYAGTFGKVNSLGYLVKLASYTKELDDDLLYYLVGDGKERDEILAEAERLGILNNNLFVLPPVRKMDLPALYSLASVGSSFVANIPELWDNSANKFFDTLAAGKPVVINHQGWQADTIRAHNVGYVLPEVVTEDAAENFVAYMKDTDLRIEQGRNARKLAEEEYSLQVASAKYMAIFSSILTYE